MVSIQGFGTFDSNSRIERVFEHADVGDPDRRTPMVAQSGQSMPRHPGRVRVMVHFEDLQRVARMNEGEQSCR